MKKPWSGRFTGGTSKLMEEFNSSIGFDRALYREDILGSIAHAQMLARQGIIPRADADSIIKDLLAIMTEIESGKFRFSTALEDIHMNIENALTARIGPAGARLHTARSRNDQVALDCHLHVKRQVAQLAPLLLELQRAVLALARRNKTVIIPGMTHLQHAQPVTLAQHLLAYFWMLARDFERLQNVWRMADLMPLGAGAIAGTTFPIDRHFVARELKFAAPYPNSMDAVADRDFVLEFLFFSAVLMTHLSRLGEELVLWSSSEFSFIELSDAYATGSSMMPQKKNPDAAELVRGKAGRTYGNLLSLLTTMKGLPLTYNKDMQEDKEPLFDSAETVRLSLAVFTGMLATLKVNRDKIALALKKDFSNATDLADYLAKKGVPFRSAHELAGRSVRLALEQGKTLNELTIEQYRELSPVFGPDLYGHIGIARCVAARDSFGGTSPRQLQTQLKAAQAALIGQTRQKKIFRKGLPEGLLTQTHDQ